MTWIQSIQKWQAISPDNQRAIRLSHVPAKVARSMTFEGEPVDQKMLEAKLASLITRQGTSKPRLAV